MPEVRFVPSYTRDYLPLFRIPDTYIRGKGKRTVHGLVCVARLGGKAWATRVANPRGTQPLQPPSATPPGPSRRTLRPNDLPCSLEGPRCALRTYRGSKYLFPLQSGKMKLQPPPCLLHTGCARLRSALLDHAQTALA